MAPAAVVLNSYIYRPYNNGSGHGSVDGDINLDEGDVSSGHGQSESDRGRTLSVSIVATSSSASTVSPTCFDHDLRVPSEKDAAIPSVN